MSYKKLHAFSIHKMVTPVISGTIQLLAETLNLRQGYKNCIVKVRNAREDYALCHSGPALDSDFSFLVGWRHLESATGE
jgi:hypothetical protein